MENEGIQRQRSDYQPRDIAADVRSLERAMLAAPDLLIDPPLLHTFTPGIYLRQIFNRAGSLIVTKIHRTEHPFMLLRGRLRIFNEADGSFSEIRAPHIGITKPGTRRVILALEDSTFVTIHANPDDTHDLDLIESRLIERQELEGGETTYEIAQRLMRQSAIGGGR